MTAIDLAFKMASDGDLDSPRSFAAEVAIEFAKYHVTKALKAALDSIPCLGSSSDIATYEEVEEAVLNAYPLENIK